MVRPPHLPEKSTGGGGEDKARPKAFGLKITQWGTLRFPAGALGEAVRNALLGVRVAW